MTYAFDPEIAPVVPLLPTIDGSDPVAARALLSQMIAQLPSPDTPGVQFDDTGIPGGPGDPEVTIRFYRPRGAQRPRRRLQPAGRGVHLGRPGNRTRLERQAGAHSASS
jgi:acetyl esterase